MRPFTCPLWSSIFLRYPQPVPSDTWLQAPTAAHHHVDDKAASCKKQAQLEVSQLSSPLPRVHNRLTSRKDRHIAAEGLHPNRYGL